MALTDPLSDEVSSRDAEEDLDRDRDRHGDPGRARRVVAYIVWTAIVSLLIWKRSGAEAPPADATGAMSTANG